jgi:predicted amino acid-binding ACT domain protein
MLVTDALNPATDDELIIRPFHSGHLGLMPAKDDLPGTEVQISINAASPSETSAGCEVLISTYHQSLGDMMQLTCTMIDEPGVVARLASAMTELDINIVTAQTSTINRADHHQINMILDWSGSNFAYRPRRRPYVSEQGVRQRLQNYRGILPIDETRYVTLFFHILAHCGSLILWEDVAGKHLPILNLRPFQHLDRSLLQTTARVEPTKEPWKVKIRLPESTKFALQTQLGLECDPLSYMLVSETEDGVLRAFFPKPERIPRLFHVAFLHTDAPGAVAVISRVVADAGFNIVTSIVRKQSKSKNSWETLLEYVGEEKEMPPIGDNKARLEWTKDQIVKNLKPQYTARLFGCDAEIRLPRYPRKKSESGTAIRFNQFMLADRAPPERINLVELLDAEIARLAEEGVPDDDPQKRLLQFSKDHLDGEGGKVFVSYPKSAAGHGRLIEAAMRQAGFRPINYQVQDGERIVGTVIESILECDFFIGIWHHEYPINGGSFSISPWMTFEYGIASAAEKPSIIVHSEKVDENIWKRIDAGVSRPAYSDLHFVRDTVTMISSYCVRHFGHLRSRKKATDNDREDSNRVRESESTEWPNTSPSRI